MAKKKKSEKIFSRRMKQKLVAVFVILILMLFALNVRLSYINMKNGDKYTIQVLAQQKYTNKTLAFKRGDILDRNGVALATSTKRYNLILDPKIILSDEKYLEATVEALASCFSYSKEEFTDVIKSKSDSSYVIQLKQLTFEEIKGFQQMQSDNASIQGVWFEETYVRQYPYASLAGDVIGFASSSDSGATGLEAYYNDYLTGINGREFGYTNTDNFMESVIKEPVDGYNLVSTIDFNIQTIVEKYIAQYKAEYSPENIAVVIADPDTGEILAMASDKQSDLNNPRDLAAYYTPEQIAAMTDEQKVESMNAIWQNYCISSSYEPGSTFKPFTVSAALEESLVTPASTFLCDGGEWKGGWQISCWKTSGHGVLDLKGTLEQSCNDSLMQIAVLLGPDKFCKFQKMFGFGENTGIDLPSEQSSAALLYAAKDMTEADLASNSFGQNFNVSMVQMVSAFSSLVNGGNYYQPHVVKQVSDENGNIVENIDKTLVKQTVSPEVSDFIREALLGVVVEGTGSAAAVAGYQVGGKTGTAEKQPRGQNKYVLSFLGFAPYDDPQVVCYTLVDSPQVDNPSSSAYASALFSQIMTEVLPYMDIYPQ
ncbi:peptidoglycan D,D-transpeptidase FtsI family protein [Parasporobacterium paucivorans]|uniref:Stage V sporulation protein D (Sporulation-specific penicillin-binding protein) n=1 Tax=Parasporobacterium paucivorans DSM 15970 TaxID=1122934 RepID=A0A1M6G2Z0_9FIRM|nr:penicillin-binding transpeptidase domain-containing protein [Parasporobacterium paucivorans]SHJ04313.1 stage V sporulation protein D (sporulation-specific penicillin-binding protein) [Parasporobacterium paucivorans DSM 15970]